MNSNARYSLTRFRDKHPQHDGVFIAHDVPLDAKSTSYLVCKTLDIDESDPDKNYLPDVIERLEVGQQWERVIPYLEPQLRTARMVVITRLQDFEPNDPPERNFEAEAHEARYESPDPTPYVSYYDKGYGDAEDWLEIEPPSDDDGLDGISNDIYPDPDDLFVPTDLGG